MPIQMPQWNFGDTMQQRYGQISPSRPNTDANAPNQMTTFDKNYQFTDRYGRLRHRPSNWSAEQWNDYVGRDRDLQEISRIEKREDNAMQRMVADVQRAGLSPHVLFGGSSSVAHVGSSRPSTIDEDNPSWLERLMFPLMLAGLIAFRRRGGR